MSKILEIDTNNLITVIDSNVRLMDLVEKVESYGLFYSPNPGEKSVTVGGNVMTNVGDMLVIKYGVTRDYVRGAEVVLPDGRIMQLGGKIAKSSSSYSTKGLIIGSEGTLVIITKVELKLIKLPRKSIALMILFENLRGVSASFRKFSWRRRFPPTLSL